MSSWIFNNKDCSDIILLLCNQNEDDIAPYLYIRSSCLKSSVLSAAYNFNVKSASATERFVTIDMGKILTEKVHNDTIIDVMRYMYSIPDKKNPTRTLEISENNIQTRYHEYVYISEFLEVDGLLDSLISVFHTVTTNNEHANPLGFSIVYPYVTTSTFKKLITKGVSVDMDTMSKYILDFVGDDEDMLNLIELIYRVNTFATCTTTSSRQKRTSIVDRLYELVKDEESAA